jgi:hypothetical protein
MLGIMLAVSTIGGILECLEQCSLFEQGFGLAFGGGFRMLGIMLAVPTNFQPVAHSTVCLKCTW